MWLTCRARSSASSSLLSFPAAQQQPAANLAVTLPCTLYGMAPREPQLHPLNATVPSLRPRLANSATRTLAAAPLGSTAQDLCAAVNPPPRYSLAPADSRRSSAPCPGSSPSSLPRSPVPASPPRFLTVGGLVAFLTPLAPSQEPHTLTRGAQESREPPQRPLHERSIDLTARARRQRPRTAPQLKFEPQ